MFAHCGQKYNFRYIQGIDRFSPSPALIFGSAVHKAIEEYHKSICGERITVSRMMDIFELEWETLLAEAKKQIEFKKASQKDNLYEIGLDIVKQYHQDHINYPEPVMFIGDNDELIPAVEISFNLSLDMEDYKISKQLHGKIDLITFDDSKTPKLMVIDHKTSSSQYDQFKVDTATQLTLYAYAFRQLVAQGKFPYIKKKKEDIAGYNVFKKIEGTKKYPDNVGEISYIRKKITEEDISHMKTIYGMMSKGIENEIFLPNYGRHCSWCEFKDVCETFKYRGAK